MPDRFFEDPRSAAVYDLCDGERDDLDHFETLLDDFACRDVLDIGSGTGALAARLDAAGLRVHGIEPAAGMFNVATQRALSSRVSWQHGYVHDVDPAARFDAAVMTDNVAQVFLDDDEWLATLRSIHARLRPNGILIFETRDPAKRAWEGWTREATTQFLDHPTEGRLEDWVHVTSVDLPLITFDGVVRFLDDGSEVRSTSTLRFRTRSELDHQLDETGFTVIDVRDAPDRPGLEFVYVCGRADVYP